MVNLLSEQKIIQWEYRDIVKGLVNIWKIFLLMEINLYIGINRFVCLFH